MTRKLVFLDIDGTLTVPGKNEPPASALAAIRAAQEAGHRVFLCTGRNLAMLRPLLRYGFDGAVASAGGYVFLGDRVLFDCPMTVQQRELALRLFRENGVFRTLEALDASFCDEGIAAFLGQISGGNSELVRWRQALEEELGIRPMAEYDGREIYKLVFQCASREQLVPVIGALDGEFHFLVVEDPRSHGLYGEMINRRFDKGSGIRRIAEALGADLADTIGFGDSENDLEMIRTVGTGVCMANGSEALQAYSKMVCPSVTEDGIAVAFRALGLC